MTRCAFAAGGAKIAGGTLDLSRLLRFEPGSKKPNVQLHAQEVIDAIGRPLTDLENDRLDVLRISMSRTSCAKESAMRVGTER